MRWPCWRRHDTAIFCCSWAAWANRRLPLWRNGAKAIHSTNTSIWTKPNSKWTQWSTLPGKWHRAWTICMQKTLFIVISSQVISFCMKICRWKSVISGWLLRKHDGRARNREINWLAVRYGEWNWTANLESNPNFVYDLNSILLWYIAGWRLRWLAWKRKIHIPSKVMCTPLALWCTSCWPSNFHTVISVRATNHAFCSWWEAVFCGLTCPRCAPIVRRRSSVWPKIALNSIATNGHCSDWYWTCWKPCCVHCRKSIVAPANQISHRLSCKAMISSTRVPVRRHRLISTIFNFITDRSRIFWHNRHNFDYYINSTHYYYASWNMVILWIGLSITDLFSLLLLIFSEFINITRTHTSLWFKREANDTNFLGNDELFWRMKKWLFIFESYILYLWIHLNHNFVELGQWISNGFHLTTKRNTVSKRLDCK